MGTGFMDGIGTALVVIAICCGVIGWGIIELVIWAASFVHITIGAVL